MRCDYVPGDRARCDNPLARKSFPPLNLAAASFLAMMRCRVNFSPDVGVFWHQILFVRWIVRRFQIIAFYSMISTGFGGRGGIRTHGALAGTPVFKTCAL